MHINIDRVKKNMEAISQIGITPEGGFTRIAFSPEDLKARDYISGYLRKIGLMVEVDPAGNIIGTSRLMGEGKAIAAGSHIDTVVNGGPFDGVLGVLLAIECCETFLEKRVSLRHPFKVVVFAAEEGVKLNGTFGSRAMAGLLSEQEIGALDPGEGAPIDVEKIREAGKQIDTIGVFLELHIEQGRVLESNHCQVGIVTDIFGISRAEVEIYGEADHAGNTPMHMRKDAFFQAAGIVQELTCFTAELKDSVVTFGKVEIRPNCVNVIPGYAKIHLEARSSSPAGIESIYSYLGTLIRKHGIDARVTKTVDKPPVFLDCQIQGLMEQVCLEQGVPYQFLSSGAGHDAASMARVLPTGMLFVPSIKGISHSPREDTSWEDIQTGGDVFLKTIIKIDAAGSF